MTSNCVILSGKFITILIWILAQADNDMANQKNGNFIHNKEYNIHVTMQQWCK